MARLRDSWPTSLPASQQPRKPQSESIARSPYDTVPADWLCGFLGARRIDSADPGLSGGRLGLGHGSWRVRVMARVAEHLSIAELEERFRTAKDPILARHVQVIWLLAQGHTSAEVSTVTSFVPRWIEPLRARSKAEGFAALGDLRRHKGRAPSLLKPDLLERLRVRLADPPPDGGLWTSGTVAGWMAGALGLASVGVQRGWEALRAIEGSIQKPRPRPPKAATPEEESTFKKRDEVVAEEAARRPDLPVEVWATDEHRLGLKPVLRRVWAPKGERPIALGHHRSKWLYVTAFTQPLSGETIWSLSTGVSKAFFAALLAAFAAESAAGRERSIVAASCSCWTKPAGTPNRTFAFQTGS